MWRTRIRSVLAATCSIMGPVASVERSFTARISRSTPCCASRDRSVCSIASSSLRAGTITERNGLAAGRSVSVSGKRSGSHEKLRRATSVRQAHTSATDHASAIRKKDTLLVWQSKTVQRFCQQRNLHADFAHRQLHNELGLARFAGKTNVAFIMTCNNPVGDVQSQARPYAKRLGCKKRLKHLVAVFRRNTLPLVGNPHAHPFAFNPCANGDFATFRGSVNRIVQQISPDLADSSAAGSKDRHIWRELFLYRDLFMAEFVTENGKGAAESIVNVQLVFFVLVFVSVFFDRHHQISNSCNALFDCAHELDVGDDCFEPVQRV